MYPNNKKVSIPVHEDCIGNRRGNDQCELKKVVKLKQEKIEQGRVLGHGKEDARTPLVLVTVYDAHDSVSLVSNENLGARARNENLMSANDKFLEVFGFVFKLWCDDTMGLRE